MSSPLDGRIRTLAREEAAALLQGTPVGADPADSDRAATLEKEVADLRAIIQRLDARLDAMEKTIRQTDYEARPATRRTRKASE
jgi:hypothetical protein